MSELLIANRQRVRAVDRRLLREITTTVLEEFLAVHEFEIGIHLVAAREMARVNSQFLAHEGSTDVITFSHAAPGDSRLHGEIFICLDDAVAQARAWRTTWQSELTRYVIHGVLHLSGYDDLAPAPRRVMKRRENALLRRAAQRFALSKLARKPSVKK